MKSVRARELCFKLLMQAWEARRDHDVDVGMVNVHPCRKRHALPVMCSLDASRRPAQVISGRRVGEHAIALV